MFIKCLSLFAAYCIFMNFNVYADESYIERRFRGVIKQKYDSTCGLASLSNVLAKSYNINKSEIDLLELIKIKPEYSFADLEYIASKYKIRTLAVKINIEQLKGLISPAIIYINRLGRGHFVVLKGINDEFVQVEDPAWGVLNYTHKQFNRYWLFDDGLGRALIFMKKHDYELDTKWLHQRLIYFN